MTTHEIQAQLGNTYEVWHRTVGATFMDNPDSVLAMFPAGFTHVANVTTDDVGRVFQLTNSIDCGWWQNPEVKVTEVVTVAGGTRSTSVGDVIVKALAVGVDVEGAPIFPRWSVQMIGLRAF